jgi:hypothetical protein
MGVSPLEFWELTPFELSLYSESFMDKRKDDYNQSIDIAFINAYFQRVETLEVSLLDKFKLTDDIEEKPQAPKQSAKSMLDQIVELNKALGGNVF